MNAPTPDQRTFTRIDFDAQASISSAEKSWNTDLLDISLKGALVEKPQDWEAEINAPFTLDVNLSDDTRIQMEVTVSHVENNHVGFRCHHIDLESITHLRRIVELNTGNEDLLHRELSALRVD